MNKSGIDFISAQIEKFSKGLDLKEVGWVSSITKEGIINVYGLENIRANEVVKFRNLNLTGLVWSFNRYFVQIVVLGDVRLVREKHVVERTNECLKVPVGENILGRIVNAFGEPIDEKGMIDTQVFRNIEMPAPQISERSSVQRPLNTGIKVIDALIPIGLGQRELIVGDKQTGKTAIAIDTILRQKDKNVLCIYVSVGQRLSDTVQIAKKLEEEGALKYTTIVFAGASENAIYKYLAPYSGCAIGEHFMYSGKDVLIVYDDLSKHATSYRELSLLLKRPPGREAYPGDIFYIHSKLLERGAQLNQQKGGGSMTAMPIVETQAGDISAYIPTNVISITDGQIFLDRDLFQQGQKPAINIGLSVSRVGSTTQISSMKKIAGKIKLELAQYDELKSFTKISSDVDEESKKSLLKGQRMYEILKQRQFFTYSNAETILLFYLVRAISDSFDQEKVVLYFRKNHLDILEEIEKISEISGEIENKIQKAFYDIK